MNIRINMPSSEGSIAPLYHQYHGQTSAQRAFLQLDHDGYVFAAWEAEVGNAVPMNVWKGIDIRIPIPNDIHRDALIDIMSSSDFKTMVGKYYSKNEDDVVSYDDFFDLFHNAERVAVYDAGDVVMYITNTHYKECGKDLLELENEILKIADADGYIIVGDLEKELKQKFEENDD